MSLTTALIPELIPELTLTERLQIYRTDNSTLYTNTDHPGVYLTLEDFSAVGDEVTIVAYLEFRGKRYLRTLSVKFNSAIIDALTTKFNEDLDITFKRLLDRIFVQALAGTIELIHEIANPEFIFIESQLDVHAEEILRFIENKVKIDSKVIYGFINKKYPELNI